VSYLRFSTDGKTLTSAGADKLCLWQVSDGKELEHRSLWDEKYRSVAPCFDVNQFVCESSYREFEVRELSTEKLLHSFKTEDTISEAQFFPGSKFALLHFVDFRNEYSRSSVYDVGTWKEVAAIPKDLYKSQGLSANGQFAVAVDRNGLNKIHLIDARQGKVRDEIKLQPDEVRDEPSLSRTYDFLFSPDCRLLAYVPKWERRRHQPENRDNDVRFWRVNDPKVVGRLKANEEELRGWYYGVLAFSPDSHMVATGDTVDGCVRVREVASGKLRRVFRGHSGAVRTLAFSSDSRLLASAGDDPTILVWDLRGPSQGEAADNKTMQENWDALLDDNSSRAYAAMWALQNDPKHSVAFLAKHLEPVPVVPRKRLGDLIGLLDSEAFDDREQGSAALAELGDSARAALLDCLNNKPSVEVRRRVEDILTKLDAWVPPPATLRALRAVEALEHIDTPEAREILKRLANGASQARLTEAAQAALGH
jgi:WD40 repeat protein